MILEIEQNAIVSLEFLTDFRRWATQDGLGHSHCHEGTHTAAKTSHLTVQAFHLQAHSHDARNFCLVWYLVMGRTDSARHA